MKCDSVSYSVRVFGGNDLVKDSVDETWPVQLRSFLSLFLAKFKALTPFLEFFIRMGIYASQSQPAASLKAGIVKDPTYNPYRSTFVLPSFKRCRHNEYVSALAPLGGGRYFHDRPLTWYRDDENKISVKNLAWLLRTFIGHDGVQMLVIPAVSLKNEDNNPMQFRGEWFLHCNSCSKTAAAANHQGGRRNLIHISSEISELGRIKGFH